ncbi:putative protein kinase domain, calcineurin-like phosphoesterase domain, ApaH type, PDPK1 family [Plasmopara halstedii]
MVSPKETVNKPSIDEFVQGKILGEGNFSRIIEATHKTTGDKFALKVIEKQRIKRLRLRHQNIFNEINMEKDVLNRLRHPNIVRLYHTFQDDNNLYFLLDLLSGGELLCHLLHNGRQHGLDERLARFYLADIVNAVEYIHRNKILHRDLKPENMVVCNDAGGHIKLIDFGTAKNLDDEKLNGPNFVGTPEYMPPETIENQNPTYASDMWSFGCIVLQLLTGETPFSGGSAYLTFLRIQNGNYYMPNFLSEDAKDLISKLLQRDPKSRLGGTETNAMSAVKAHPFFKGIDFDNHMLALPPSNHFCGSKLFSLVKSLVDAESKRDAQHPLSYDDDLLQKQIEAQSSRDKSILMHILRRQQVLHLPGMYPRFFSSVSLGRCMYARDHVYLGLEHELQNQWTENFSFMLLSGPKLGLASAIAEADNRGGSTWETELATFLDAIDILNSQRPAFVVICGDFVNASPSQEFYDAQVKAFQKLLNQLIPAIRLVFVAGCNEFRDQDEFKKYQERFGDARFSFWFGGIKFVVANTAILCGKNWSIEEAAQAEWIKFELSNGKLCARGTAVISGHSLSPKTLGTADVDTTESTHDTHNDDVPEQFRAKYWDIIKNGQACILMSGSSHTNNETSVVIKASEEGADEYNCDIVRCKTPWGGASSVIYHTEVSQSSLTSKPIYVEHASARFSPSPIKATQGSSIASEENEQQSVLASEMVSLSVSLADN